MLFDGDKGRKVIAPNATAKGGLGAYLRRGDRCLACRTPMPNSNAFCAICEGTEAADNARRAKATEGDAVRKRNEVLQSACAQCTNSAIGKDAPTLCANVACDIFFERFRSADSVKEHQAAFAR